MARDSAETIDGLGERVRIGSHGSDPLAGLRRRLRPHLRRLDAAQLIILAAHVDDQLVWFRLPGLAVVEDLADEPAVGTFPEWFVYTLETLDDVALVMMSTWIFEEQRRRL